MTRSSPLQVSFSSGEVSPLLYGREDYQRVQTGLRIARGWLPLRQGGITRAPGTLHLGSTDGDGEGRLIAFEFAIDDALQLEFTDGKMRVWRYGALVMDGAIPYELTIPYDLAAIRRLQWVQTADRIYLADGVRPVQVLSRFALDNWSIDDFLPSGGPFRAGNADETLTVQASAATGTGMTLTASSALFSADMVGGLIELRPFQYDDIPQWTGNTTVAPGDRMRSDGNVYEVVSGTNTRVVRPVHLEGDELVEKGGPTWRFIDDGVGIARITGFTSATEVTADVVKRIPQPCVDDPTYLWAEGAWSEKNGYPAALELHDQRLVAAATAADPRTIWASVVGDFTDFTAGANADDGFAYTVAGSRSLNRIVWLRSGTNGLYIGALGEQLATRGESFNQVIGPTNFVLRVEAAIGAKSSPPVAPDGKPIFISRDGRRLFEMRFAFEEEKNQPIELSLPSEHLGGPGFEEIVWQSAAQRFGWLRRGDGTLAAMLYDPIEDVLGFAPLPVAGGFVESFCVTPDLATGKDELTMIVRRVVDGVTRRFVEVQSPVFALQPGEPPLTEANHFFSASVFTADPATADFSVPHLEGEEVWAWTDAGQYGPITVGAGGAITLDQPCTRATIGLFDDTHEAETLDVRAAARDGSSMGRKKRILPGSGIRLHRTAALKVGLVERSLGEADVRLAGVDAIPRGVAADLTQSFSGVGELQIAGGHCHEVSFAFEPQGGAPATVLALNPLVKEEGA